MPETLSFKEEEIEKIEKILQIYYFVKETLIFSENIDVGTFPQVINEIRNAYDHIVRVLSYKLENSFECDTDYDTDYSIKNLSKALGHVYRAAYDNLDWLSLNLIEDIKSRLNISSKNSVNEKISRAYSEVMPKIIKYEEDIIELRAGKDIARINSNSLIKYTAIVKDLAKIQSELKNITDP